jgi:hypothetical protein
MRGKEKRKDRKKEEDFGMRSNYQEHEVYSLSLYFGSYGTANDVTTVSIISSSLH